jgi:hypothetical protein
LKPKEFLEYSGLEKYPDDIQIYCSNLLKDLNNVYKKTSME